MAAKWWERACCACMLNVYPTLCDPSGCSLPGSSVHGIFGGRITECVAMPFSMGSSRPRGLNSILFRLPTLADGFFTTSATWEAWRKRWVLLIHRLTETIFFFSFLYSIFFSFTLFFPRESMNTVFHYYKLSSWVFPIWGSCRGQHIRIGLALGKPPSW